LPLILPPALPAHRPRAYIDPAGGAAPSPRVSSRIRTAVAFLNKQTGFYYAELVLPGYGKLPRLSLGTTSRPEAERTEQALRELGRRASVEPRLRALLDGLRPRGHGRSGQLSPTDILKAIHEESGLENLFGRLNDPLVGEALEEYLRGASATREDRHARRTLLRYAGEKPLSALLEPGGVQVLLEAVQRGEGKRRASVVRYEKRLLSRFLAWRLGREERDRVFRSVAFAAEEDVRRLRTDVVTREAVARLLAAFDAAYWKPGDEAARLYAEIALTTGAEISRLSRTPQHSLQVLYQDQAEWGLLYLGGAKGGGEDRRQARHHWLLPSLMARVRTYWRPSEPGAPLFPLSYGRFYTLWKKAVLRAGLEHAAHDHSPLRPRDLHSVHTLFAEEARIERAKIARTEPGRSRPDLADRHLLRGVALSPEEMRRLEHALQGSAPSPGRQG
jgi:hypothetical protein